MGKTDTALKALQATGASFRITDLGEGFAVWVNHAAQKTYAVHARGDTLPEAINAVLDKYKEVPDK